MFVVLFDKRVKSPVCESDKIIEIKGSKVEITVIVEVETNAIDTIKREEIPFV